MPDRWAVVATPLVFLSIMFPNTACDRIPPSTPPPPPNAKPLPQKMALEEEAARTRERQAHQGEGEGEGEVKQEEDAGAIELGDARLSLPGGSDGDAQPREGSKPMA